MKKIVYAVYHDTNTEERSRELLDCCRKMGEVTFVSYAMPRGVNDIKSHIINKKSPFALISFIIAVKETIKKVNPDYVFLHDNDCSAVIPFVKKNFPNAKIIYDSSELYIKKKTHINTKNKQQYFWGNNGILIWIKQKVTAFRAYYEKKYLKQADVVLAANYERAKIMKDYFGLKSLPSIFDNMHKIEEVFDEKKCQDKFGTIIDRARFNILFGGGLSEERKTFDYIKAFNKLDDRFNLVIAGSSSAVAKKNYDKLISEKKIKNIHYVGFISRADLKYLMKECQASVVVFDKDSYNTLYCASGKCYESLFEGTPILASENPPLKRLCEEENVGVSNDDYKKGILQLYKNYDQYVEGVKNYIKKIKYEERENYLIEEIKTKLGEKSE